jgi:hypothetical protein
MLDFLPNRKLSVLELLPNPNSFTRHLKDYMDTCKVEGKSPRTLVIYKTHIDRYLSVIRPETPNASNALGYLASLKDRGYAPATIHQAFRRSGHGSTGKV